MNVLIKLIEQLKNKKEKAYKVLYCISSTKEDALKSINIGEFVYIQEEQKMFLVTEYDNEKVLIGLE